MSLQEVHAARRDKRARIWFASAVVCAGLTYAGFSVNFKDDALKKAAPILAVGAGVFSLVSTFAGVSNRKRAQMHRSGDLEHLYR